MDRTLRLIAALTAVGVLAFLTTGCGGGGGGTADPSLPPVVDPYAPDLAYDWIEVRTSTSPNRDGSTTYGRAERRLDLHASAPDVRVWSFFDPEYSDTYRTSYETERLEVVDGVCYLVGGGAIDHDGGRGFAWTWERPEPEPTGDLRVGDTFEDMVPCRGLFDDPSAPWGPVAVIRQSVRWEVVGYVGGRFSVQREAVYTLAPGWGSTYEHADATHTVHEALSIDPRRGAVYVGRSEQTDYRDGFTDTVETRLEAR